MFDSHLDEQWKGRLQERILHIGYLACQFTKTEQGDEFRVVLATNVHSDSQLIEAVLDAEI